MWSNPLTTRLRSPKEDEGEIQSTKLWDLSDNSQQAFCIHLNSAIWNLLEKFTYWPLVYSSCIPFCMFVCRAPDYTTTAELCPFLSITSRIGSSTSVRSTKDQPPIQRTVLCHEGWPGSPCTYEKRWDIFNIRPAWNTCWGSRLGPITVNTLRKNEIRPWHPLLPWTGSQCQQSVIFNFDLFRLSDRQSLIRTGTASYFTKYI